MNRARGVLAMNNDPAPLVIFPLARIHHPSTSLLLPHDGLEVGGAELVATENANLTCRIYRVKSPQLKRQVEQNERRANRTETFESCG